ncbi:LysM peptidoglycan-binding domain-containing protein [Pigmentiphaga sp. H8]|uniref:FecR domain-containing protein n=1 Tax=Pigmentiphaga sp. H8 TaxID=2488560 RepID=UPI000F5A68E2|nr:FecR domain-containing protein [Pigmentiphaga sp. H8]AZG08890.1 LysM peptidoglycan-binding domain-containing protein [Pigmentiphaga sp. H8]
MKNLSSMDAGIRLSAWAIAAACAFGTMAAHAQQAEPVRHLVRDGDTLYDLAQAYLEDPGQWQALARENGNPNPHRLKPGSVIVVPDELLRKKPGGARVVHVSGGVRYTTRSGSTGALERDMRLIDGDRLSTDAGGFATLEMADGSVVRVAGDSELRLERLKYSLTKKRADTSLVLDKGRVESRVAPQRPTGSRFQVDTPLMAAGVRGTEFGVSMREGSAATSDVLEGEVELRVARSGATARVAAGVGGAVATDAPAATLTPLLAAPDLSGVQALQQRPIIDLAFPALAGAASYRAFIWPASTAEQVASNLVTTTPRVRFAGLDDGDYVVRINGVDAQGIEGRPVTWPIKLKARPEPPVTIAPPDGGVVEQTEAVLRWTGADGTIGYRLQVSRDQAFTHPSVDENMLSADSHAVGGLTSGNYFWRVGSVIQGKDGKPDAGPYSDPRRFMVRLPVGGKLGMSQQGDEVVLSWDGEEGQNYLVQVARDTGFAGIAAERRTTERKWALEALPAGEYFVRIRATDSDGYVRDFTRPQRFRVNRTVRSGDGSLRSGDGQEIQLP